MKGYSSIDFSIAVGLLLVSVVFIIMYTANYVSSQALNTQPQDLDAEADKVELMLFGSPGNPADWESSSAVRAGLLEYAKEAPIEIKEIAGRSHTEQVVLELDVQQSGLEIYGPSGRIESTKSGTNPLNLSFQLSLAAGEERMLKLVYFGGSLDAVALMGGGNISMTAASERSLPAVSYEKWSKLLGMDYETVRQQLTEEQFRLSIGNRTFGPEQPGTNVIIKEIPIIAEQSDGSITEEMAVLALW